MTIPTGQCGSSCAGRDPLGPRPLRCDAARRWCAHSSGLSPPSHFHHERLLSWPSASMCGSRPLSFESKPQDPTIRTGPSVRGLARTKHTVLTRAYCALKSFEFYIYVKGQFSYTFLHTHILDAFPYFPLKTPFH